MTDRRCMMTTEQDTLDLDGTFPSLTTDTDIEAELRATQARDKEIRVTLSQGCEPEITVDLLVGAV